MDFKFNTISSLVSNLLSGFGSPTLLCVFGSRMFFNLNEAAEHGVNIGTNWSSYSHSTIRFGEPPLEYMTRAYLLEIRNLTDGLLHTVRIIRAATLASKIVGLSTSFYSRTLSLDSQQRFRSNCFANPWLCVGPERNKKGATVIYISNANV